MRRDDSFVPLLNSRLNERIAFYEQLRVKILLPETRSLVHLSELYAPVYRYGQRRSFIVLSPQRASTFHLDTTRSFNSRGKRRKKKKKETTHLDRKGGHRTAIRYFRVIFVDEQMEFNDTALRFLYRSFRFRRACLTGEGSCNDVEKFFFFLFSKYIFL